MACDETVIDPNPKHRIDDTVAVSSILVLSLINFEFSSFLSLFSYSLAKEVTIIEEKTAGLSQKLVVYIMKNLEFRWKLAVIHIPNQEYCKKKDGKQTSINLV